MLRKLLYIFLLILYSLDSIHTSSHNEASRDNSDVWLVVFLCLLFCFALRHMNDFYVGESVTLVTEGEYAHRFSRRQSNKQLKKIERDFDDMFQKLSEKYEKDLDSEGCCGYYEEEKDKSVIP